MPVLDITGFFFHIRTQVTYLGLHLITHVEKETRYIQLRSASFVSIILYPMHIVVILCSVSSVKIKGDCVRIVYIGGIDDHHCLNVFLIKENKNINTTTQNNLKNMILVSVNNKYMF
jgi:hypothetical protein